MQERKWCNAGAGKTLNIFPLFEKNYQIIYVCWGPAHGEQDQWYRKALKKPKSQLQSLKTQEVQSVHSYVGCIYLKIPYAKITVCHVSLSMGII